MNIFGYLDYRTAVEDFLEEARRKGLSLNISKLADKINVQKTYVSRVLRKQAHFSSDQIFACGAALGLSQEETDYLILLMEHDRAGIKDRKKLLYSRIQEKQSEKRKIQEHIPSTMVETSIEHNLVQYYLDPRMPVVYVHLMIPEFGRDPSKIRNIIPMPPEQLKFILATLEQLKLVERGADQKSYKVTVKHIHLPKESPLSFPAEQLSRAMAFEQMKRLPKEKRFYYSASFTADEATRAFLHDEFLRYIRQANERITPASSEAAYHMSFDLFPWNTD